MKITSKGHTVELTDQEFYDIVETAGYGIGYWCRHAVVKDGCEYVVEDTEGDGTNHTVTKAGMERVMAAMLDGDIKIGDYIVGYIRQDEIDSEAADAIVQACCFDEVRYG